MFFVLDLAFATSMKRRQMLLQQYSFYLRRISVVKKRTQELQCIASDRFNINSQLEHLQAKYVGTGHADLTRFEWAVNIHRDSYASYVGHYPMLAYFAVAENESIGRERYNFMQSTTWPLNGICRLISRVGISGRDRDLWTLQKLELLYINHQFVQMATSAFKSTTKRASIGGSTSEDSSRRSLRRSRSLSRFSRPIAPEPETETDYNKNVPRGKFVNTTRGSTTPFPEISLDDLALEFFSSSSKNENESDGVVVERKGREGRSASRHGEIGRWASDTASSRRRGRSVSKTRGNVVSSSSASGGKNVISSDAGSRRRRSLSVARYQISDSESEVDHSRNLSNRATVKAPFNGNSQMPLAHKTIASSNRRLGRSRSHRDLSLLHDGYSSQSSALTDEESKDTHFGKNGFEKIIRAVYAQKAEHPTEDVANGGLYEVMRKELRYAVQEIRTELNQVEKHKQDLLSEMLLEEQRGQEVLKMVKELPNSRTLAVAEKPSRARKKSSARSGMSKELIDEAKDALKISFLILKTQTYLPLTGKEVMEVRR
ncbi:hypothetical protein DH2020_013583 [Rehmannia glutinosa]|uniref:Uncharacterized protein n=1 Tax=Rehmannia glutinosa TaxID=99300 RepID=A0ABR0X5T7_REHGL